METQKLQCKSGMLHARVRLSNHKMLCMSNRGAALAYAAAAGKAQRLGLAVASTASNGEETSSDAILRKLCVT